MGSDYRELYTSYWPWALRHGLDDSARCLGAYLLTCDHRTFEGIYRLPAAYAMADLGWTQDTFDQAFSKLTAEGFVLVDPRSDVVFLVNALEYRQPKGAKQIAGAINTLKRLPETQLMRNLFDAAREYAADFADAIEGVFPSVADTPSIGLPELGAPEQTLNRPEPEPEQNQNSAQERAGTAASLDDARRKLKDDQVRQVFDAWVTATDRDLQRTKLTDDRRRRIERALKSHGLDDCLLAVRNIGASQDARTGYGRGQRYDDIEHTLGSTERIERWRDATPAAATAAAAGAPKLTNSRDTSRFKGL